MKFLVDNQLPAALARWLVGMGVQADHVLDLGLRQASDSAIWTLAIQQGGIVVSKDDDFLLLASRPRDMGRLLWVRVGNCRTPSLLSRFAAAWPTIENAFANGQRVVELR